MSAPLLLAGNWKMYKTVPEAVALAAGDPRRPRAPPTDRDVLVAPPFTALHAVGEALRGSAVAPRRAEHALGARGRLHGRDLAARCCATSAAPT